MDSTARLTIRAIRARGLNLTLERPIQTASGIMNTTPLVLVDLLTQEGITGHQPLARISRPCWSYFEGTHVHQGWVCNGS